MAGEVGIVITSQQNAKIKLVRALLGRARERHQAGAFVVEGVRLVEEAESRDWRLRFALYDDSLRERGLRLVKKLEEKKIEVKKVESRLLQSLSDTQTPQGVLAVVELKPFPIPPSPNFVLIPDQIRDPGNLGTLLRSAAAVGVQAVLIPSDTTDAFAPKVVRSGMGAHFRLPIHVVTWSEIEQVSKSANLQIFLADMEGRSCWETDLRQPLALIVGSEAEGASEQARKLTTQKISIPMSGDIESLNAGVAGSVLMFEVVRQRNTPLVE